MTEPAELLRALAARDRFMQVLGMELVDAKPGRAAVRMTVREEHLNFNGTCHGGVLFALTDSAFGLSSNSHAAVAAGIDAHIAYPAAARLGDKSMCIAMVYHLPHVLKREVLVETEINDRADIGQ